MAQYSEVINYLKSSLTKKRLDHSYRVAETAVLLAKRYGINLDRAHYAGLFHDIAREMSDEELFHWIERSPIRPPTVFEREHPPLLHGLAGSALLYHRFGIHDDSLLRAVANHTIGEKGMDGCSKVVYIADYLEPGRKYHDSIPSELKKSEIPLDSLLKSVMELGINHLKARKKESSPKTRALLRTLKYGI